MDLLMAFVVALMATSAVAILGFAFMDGKGSALHRRASNDRRHGQQAD